MNRSGWTKATTHRLRSCRSTLPFAGPSAEVGGIHDYGQKERTFVSLPSKWGAVNPIETRPAEIWCAVRRIPNVGREDDFFAAGGDSLLMTKVVSHRDRAARHVERKS
jgi:hypothetical protein